MTNQTQQIELNTQHLNLTQSEPMSPARAEELGADIRRIALEALRGITRPNQEPCVAIACNIDQTIAEVESKVHAMRQEFQYEDANPFDKLVIEQLLLAWVQWYVAGWLLEGELSRDRTWRENHYFTKRYHQCQFRLSKAIDQLARIRQISGSYLILETRAEKEAKAERRRQEQAKWDTSMPSTKRRGRA